MLGLFGLGSDPLFQSVFVQLFCSDSYAVMNVAVEQRNSHCVGLSWILLPPPFLPLLGRERGWFVGETLDSLGVEDLEIM